MLQFTQQQLAQVGIKAQLTAMDAGQRAAEVEGKGQKESGVRMFYTGWSASTGEATVGAVAAVCFAKTGRRPCSTPRFMAIRRWIKIHGCAENHRCAGKTRLYKDAGDYLEKVPVGCRWWWKNWSQRTAKNLTGFYIQPDTGFSFEQADLSQ